MAKVYISQPMRGIPDDEILRVRKDVIAWLEKNGHEVLNPEIGELATEGYKHPALASLGRSITEMAKADTLCSVNEWRKARGCKIEYYAAQEYGLNHILLTIR